MTTDPSTPIQTPQDAPHPNPRYTEYMRLSELRHDPANPKAHDLTTLDDSVTRFGFVEGIALDERTGYIVAGHGRHKVLSEMLERQEEPPEGIRTAEDGEWLVPVQRGWASNNDADARAYLIASNRTTELGGWVDEELLTSLESLSQSEGGLTGVGYDAEDIGILREMLGLDEDGMPPSGGGYGGPYSRDTGVPQYEPRSDEPAPQPTDLVDRSKTDELTERIRTTDLPDDVRAFLEAGAQRHLQFNYARIADYYAHAPSHVQALMEESALVIIDVEDAIRNGYVKLTEDLDRILDRDRAANAELDQDGETDTGGDEDA